MSLWNRFAARKPIALETKVGAGAGLLTAAAVLLMPVVILQQAVVASGLAGMLPPLEPPLGMKARVGLALLAAGMAFGFVVTVVNVLGRIAEWRAARAARASGADEADHADSAVETARSPMPVPPKVRRRDRHPDAPVRAPLSIAEVDLARDETARPVATRMIRSGRNAEEIEPVAEPIAPEPVFEAPVAETVEEPEAVAFEEVFEPAPVAPQPVVGTRPAWLDDNVAQAEPEAEAQREPARQQSLTELVERLEKALERRADPARSQAGSPAGAAAGSPAVAPRQAEAGSIDAGGRDGADLRLRDALESLKRFAPQRG